MMYLLAIDPGSTHSGWVELLDGRLLAHGKDRNEDVLRRLVMSAWDQVRIERITLYGKAGNDVRDACEWVGRLHEASIQSGNGPAILVPRSAVRGYYSATNDREVRAAVIARYDGDTSGVTADAWQALALALMELKEE